jgi:hypothetical protein
LVPPNPSGDKLIVKSAFVVLVVTINSTKPTPADNMQYTVRLIRFTFHVAYSTIKKPSSPARRPCAGHPAPAGETWFALQAHRPEVFGYINQYQLP